MKNNNLALAGLAVTVFCFSTLLAPQSSAATQNTTSEMAPPCSVHLWDGSDFTDNDIVISGPGKFSNLRKLPGANNKDWGDEADSLKVGSTASVKAWKEENFKGTPQTYSAGTEHPNLSEEPSSLEITCK